MHSNQGRHLMDIGEIVFGDMANVLERSLIRFRLILFLGVKSAGLWYGGARSMTLYDVYDFENEINRFM